MFKLLVILSPSSQPENNCVICGSEEAHSRHLAKLIRNYLDNYPNITTKIISKQPQSRPTEQKLKAIVNESNKYVKEFMGAALHVALHTNAFNSKAAGNMVAYYPNNQITQELAYLFQDRLDAPTTVIENKTWCEMRATKANALYFETYYHDNISDAWKLHVNLNKTANIIATGLLYHSRR